MMVSPPVGCVAAGINHNFKPNIDIAVTHRPHYIPRYKLQVRYLRLTN
jgi:hypothetical protein